MTWQLASFALLAVALAAGFAWYERAHPSAKVLAGGWHFATETARVLDGAALLPEDGAELLRRHLTLEVPAP